MAPPRRTPTTRTEREDTDASLRAERKKTDAQLARTVESSEATADRVVAVARRRAKSTLDAARQRADSDMTAAGATDEARRGIALERAWADAAVTDERVTAKSRLVIERDERERALLALLRLEREATDEGLVIERARADQAVATRDEFLAIVSHDLRTILGAIALGASLLAKPSTREGDDSTATRKQAERIQRLTARMNRLVGDLLDLVSLEAGKLEVTVGPADAKQLVMEAFDAFHPSFHAKGITLSADPGAGGIVAAGDHDRILQVLANLLSNALKFTPAGACVSLSVAVENLEVRFSVIDGGPGVPAGCEKTIFERFRQLADLDRQGLGLGLYIAKCIVEAHRGRIWVESPQRGGAAFHFTIPKMN
jgi:signal transduction histidine kinase